MLRQVVSCVFCVQFLSLITAVKLPMIRDAFLIGMDVDVATTLYNTTCDQCLCQTLTKHTILNCFPDNKCEYFDKIPVRYRLKRSVGARLFFLQSILPKKSLCRMPNTTEVMKKLRNGTHQYISITHPRCLTLDLNKNVLVALDHNTYHLREYNATDLIQLREINLNFPRPLSLAENGKFLYVGYGEGRILLVDKNTFNVSEKINSSYLTGARDLMFLNDGEILVVAATQNHSLVFFKRTDDLTESRFVFFFKQTFDSVTPHGLFYVNDTFFYASSWYNDRVYSFTKLNETFWNSTLIIDNFPNQGQFHSAHVIIDECNRFWFVLGNLGLYVFDQHGNFIESYMPDGLSYTFHAIITDDYVLYVSDNVSHKILRIDPNIFY